MRGAWLALAALIVPASALAADSKQVTFTRNVAPIFQEKCESCHRPDNMAPMSLRTYEEARPWVRSIAQRVGSRQMPPWHIDKTIGIQKFKNDRSLSDDQIDTIMAWVAAGAPKGDPQDMPAPKVWNDETGWTLAAKYGQPDLIVKSPEYTMPAVAQDAWWRPSVPTGLTEPRWVRAIEIRPVGKNARKITHHALARLQQTEEMDAALFTNDPNVAGDGLFMEWAVGKNGDEMRPDSGRLMLPGSKIVWEMHYHAVGEEISAHTELGVYFYPKGQEPKHREVLALFNTFSGGARALDISPNKVTTTESFVSLKRERPHRKLPGAHAPARQGHVDGSTLSGRPPRDAEPGDGLQLQLAQHVHLRGRCGAAPAQGHDAPLHRVVRQHVEQQVEPGSRSVGGLGRSHGG